MVYGAKRALITGVRGFTGRYVADELQRNGYEVFGLGHGSEVEGESGFARIDINDRPAVQALCNAVKPHVVIHLAALAFVGHGDADDFYNVNLIGTRRLLEAIASTDVRPERILLASSANIYGNSPLELLEECSPVAPANDYAVSKLAMEYMAGLWKDRLPLIIARPFNYTGIGQGENFLLPKIVSHFRRRADRIELGNLDVSRDFSDVRTIAHVYRRLLEKPEAVGQTFNVSSGVAYSLREVVAICEELTGHRMKLEVNPAFVRTNEVRTLRGDNSRLRELLDHWNAIPLRETLEWMLSGS
ncbi:GDP-mannose 4,6-dehydratase [Pseudoxanthomonas sp. 22568]|uniref:GDP-mannose 4,6-dehydratase n=1 Tax=Pseudoxanthomonas sp. 22568 TaxID=3453945 RepID=UPI003F8516DC